MSEHDTLDIAGTMHVYFDRGGGCEGVEAFTRGGPSVIYRGHDLLLSDAEALASNFVGMDVAFRVDTYGLHAPALGIATFHHDFDWKGRARGIDALYVSLDP